MFCQSNERAHGLSSLQINSSPFRISYVHTIAVPIELEFYH